MTLMPSSSSIGARGERPRPDPSEPGLEVGPSSRPRDSVNFVDAASIVYIKPLLEPL